MPTCEMLEKIDGRPANTGQRNDHGSVEKKKSGPDPVDRGKASVKRSLLDDGHALALH